MGFEPGHGVFQFTHMVDPKGNVIDPCRCVGRGGCGLVVSQVKKSDEGTILQAKKNVRVWAVLARAGHMVTLDDVVERQTQNIFIKMPRLFSVACAVSAVVQLLNGHGRWQGGWPRVHGMGCGHVVS